MRKYWPDGNLQGLCIRKTIRQPTSQFSYFPEVSRLWIYGMLSEKAVKQLFREALPHAKASVPCKSGCFAMGSAIFGAISPMETDFLPFFAATAMGALQVLPFRKVFDRPEVWIIFTACCVCCVLILRPCPAFTNAETLARNAVSPLRAALCIFL